MFSSCDEDSILHGVENNGNRAMGHAVRRIISKAGERCKKRGGNVMALVYVRFQGCCGFHMRVSASASGTRAGNCTVIPGRA
jgi:hypothetical protein